MKINLDNLLAALAGGAKGAAAGYADEQDRRRVDQDRADRLAREQREDDQRLRQIKGTIDLGTLQASQAVDKAMREEADRAAAGRSFRAAVSAVPNVPQSVLGYVGKASDKDLGAMEPSAISSLFVSPHVKFGLEEVQQAGRQSVAEMNNEAKRILAEISQAGQNARLDKTETGKNTRLGVTETGKTTRLGVTEGGKNTRQEKALEAAKQRDSTKSAAKGSFDDLLGKYAAPATATPAEAPLESKTDSIKASLDQKRKDLDAAIRALRAKGVPKRQWPEAVTRAMRELGVPSWK